MDYTLSHQVIINRQPHKTTLQIHDLNEEDPAPATSIHPGLSDEDAITQHLRHVSRIVLIDDNNRYAPKHSDHPQPLSETHSMNESISQAFHPIHVFNGTADTPTITYTATITRNSNHPEATLQLTHNGENSELHSFDSTLTDDQALNIVFPDLLTFHGHDGSTKRLLLKVPTLDYANPEPACIAAAPDDQNLRLSDVSSYIQQFDPLYHAVFQELVRGYANSPKFHQDLFDSIEADDLQIRDEYTINRMEFIGDYITRQSMAIAFKYVDNRAEFIDNLNAAYPQKLS